MKLSHSFLLQALPSCMVGVVQPLALSKISDLSVLPIHLRDFEECEVSIDTRTLQKGDIFLALTGTQVDGHSYLAQAALNGASALIIDESKRAMLEGINAKLLEQVLVITVADTLQALISLAKAWRSLFSIPIVGVTGSIGKTSTKEMLRMICNDAGIPACISRGNQNTVIGLCLNVLRINQLHKVGVFEVGISERGEMALKADILRPTCGVITSIAHAHAKFLGTLYDIAHEKKQLFAYFQPHEIGIIPGDLPVFNPLNFNHPVIRFGTKIKNQVQARKLQMTSRLDPAQPTAFGMSELQFMLKLYDQKVTVCMQNATPGMVHNALAATCVAHLLGIPLPLIVQSLGSYQSFEGRFERRVMKNKRGILIHDSYNASPESMKNAIFAFQNLSTPGKKIAVLGDMLELGEKEEFWHRQIGRLLCKAPSVERLILVGNLAKAIAKTAPLTMKIDYAATWQQAQERLQEVLEDNSLILFKGSHAVGLSNIVAQLS